MSRPRMVLGAVCSARWESCRFFRAQRASSRRSSRAWPEQTLSQGERRRPASRSSTVLSSLAVTFTRRGSPGAQA